MDLGRAINSADYLLDEIRIISQEHIQALEKFTGNPCIQKISNKYRIHSNRKFEIGLNLFTLISEQYQKENLHSDILKEILDPNGRHKEGNKFLMLFIEYLNSHSKRVLFLKDKYHEAFIERETGKIDISIKDNQSKHAIIIENKINNAGDMNRQIPRYWIDLEENGFTVDGVIYLVLNGNKQPDTSSWSKEERERMLPKVLPVCAYNETINDLYNGWLLNCEKFSENIDAVFLFRQYNRLILYQGGKNMNKPLMEDFLSKMLDKQNYQTAYALRDMLDELPNYRRDKIIDYFRYTALPFTRVGDWKNLAVFDCYIVGNNSYAIDIIVNKDIYQVQFFERQYLSKTEIIDTTNPVIPILEEIGLHGDFFSSGRRMEKQFKFPEQESELYIFLARFIEALQKRDIELNK